MFVSAIEKAAKFTKPLHTITRSFNGKSIIPGAATLFLINDEGYAITCKHVIDLIAQADIINRNYINYKTEKSTLLKDGSLPENIQKLNEKYKYNDQSTVQIKNSFVDCVDAMSGITWHLHPTADLAILKFNDFKNLHCTEFPVFKKDTSEIKQGKFLCRLGFPFPEFNNFRYDEVKEDIEWTNTGMRKSPQFPIEGMITRFLGDEKGNISGIEMSTPGLRGQSGGPLFDENGIICGMQTRTKHLHLGFDIEDKEIISKGSRKKINNYSFIHLGECVHVNLIKSFLKKHNVKFNEI